MVLVLNLPNFTPWERNLYPNTYLFDFQERLAKCVLLAALFFSLFSRLWKAWLVAWCLFLWWAPVSIAVRLIVEAPITSNLVGTAMASSAGELANLALSIPKAWFVAFVGWNMVCAAIFVWLKRRPTWRWPFASRGKIFLFCALLLLVPFFYKEDFWSATPPAIVVAASVDPFAEADQPMGADADLPLAFPYELPWALAQYGQARQVVDEARAGLRPVGAGSALAVGAGSPDVVVLVIGESSSRKFWHLFNPAASATTPLLDARWAQGRNLYPLLNVVAQSTSTRQAVPSMLTAQPLLWPDGSPNPQATHSIVSQASSAGYASAWFSNQAAVGRFDGVIAAYADEAAAKAFLNPSTFFQQGSYDEVLVPALRRHVAGHAKSFIVLHTLGSHFKFEHRYPPPFEVFPSSENLDNAYRNSIVYTDFVLDQVIATLERDGRSAAMVYVSDHGQGLPNDQCGKAEINRTTVDSYEVPALVWLSSAYEAASPAVPEALRKNAQGPYTNAAVYQTLSDLIAGGLTTDNDSAQGGAPSFLRSPPPENARMVVSPAQRWVNFQDAVHKNPCVIGAY